MSTTSAIPTNLDVFASTLSTARATCSHNCTAANTQYQAMIAACGGYGVASTNLGSLDALLGNFSLNEQYVKTIHDELVKADHGGDTPASVDSGVVLAALESKGLATPPPPVTVQPSEVFGVPPTSGFVDDPVCAANGNFVHAETDLRFPGHASALDVQRMYNSLATDTSGAFGPGWTTLADIALKVVAEDEIRVRIADGATIYFHPASDPAGSWPANGRRDLRLEPGVDGSWVLVESPERRWTFDTNGVLLAANLGPAQLELQRRHGRVVRMVEHRSGRSIGYRWSGAGGNARIVRATSNDGRSVDYEYDASGVLRRVIGAGGTADYELDGRLIVALHDADGVEHFRNRYDETGRVLQQVSAFGRVTDYSYAAGGTTVITDQFGCRNAMVHDRSGNLTSVVATDGRAMRLTYDRHGRTTSVSDRDGNLWRYTFDDATGDLLSRTDPDGRSASWTWDEQHRLIAETDRAGNSTTSTYVGDLRRPSTVTTADGAVATAVHDELGYPTRITDADGVVVNLTWDRDGQLRAITDAQGNTTRVDFDEAGLYMRMLDATGIATQVERDASGRILRHVVPGATSTYDYTPAGRAIGGSEPGGLPWSSCIGAHGKPVSLTDGAGSTASFEYDTNGNIVAVTAPDGGVYRNVFDSMGQLLDSIDPSGSVWTRKLDANGNIVEFVEPTGRRSRRTVDAWGRTLTSTAPDGGVTTYTYHPAAGIATITTADGKRWTTEVDVCGRQTAVIDPQGRRSTVRYTPGGRVAERRSPAGRSERFHYDDRGRLVSIDAVDGTTRRIERDATGRLLAVDTDGHRVEWSWTDAGTIASATDASGTTRIERDAAGLVRAIVDATGATTQFDWDARGVLTAATDPAGDTTRYAHDERGRLSTQTTPGGATTSYSYNATGHVDSITEPAAGTTVFDRDPAGRFLGVQRSDGSGWSAQLDEVGRTTSVTDRSGDLLARFGYDDAGRLAEAVSSDGFTTSFLWDDDDLLLGVDGVDGRRTYERDADGAVVSESDHLGHRIDYVRDGTGTIVAIIDSELGELTVPTPTPPSRDEAGRIVARADGTAFRYDPAGRLVEVAPVDGPAVSFGYDDRGLLAVETTAQRVRRYAYDAAGRLTGIADLPGGRFQFTYDLAGRRTSESWPDGSEVVYRWDALGRLTAIERAYAAGAVEITNIDVDAVGRIVAAGGIPIGWDRATSQLPDRVGQQRFHHANGLTCAAGSSTWTGSTDVVVDAPPNAGITVTASGHLAIDNLVVLGVRCFDSNTRQFLSPDPLDPLPGTPGAASPYTYGWNDPVNHFDPSGLRPISQEEFDAIRKQEEQGKLGAAWEAIKKDPWGAAGMALVAAVGVGLCFVPGGQAIGVGILIGVGTSAAMGIATGTFDPRAVAINGIVGGFSGGFASAATSIPRAVAIGAATEGTGNIATQLATGDHSIDWGEAAVATGFGGFTGGLAQKFFPTGGSTSGLTDDVISPPAPPSGAAGSGGTAASSARFEVSSSGVVTDLKPVNPTQAALWEHMDAAKSRLAVEGLTPAQAAAAAKHPWLGPVYEGSQLDTFMKESVATDPRLAHLDITTNGYAGPDFVDPATGGWYDLTTPGQWRKHVNLYGPGGIPVFHK